MFEWMTRYGMTPLQAIQAATINAADLMGWADQVGAIEPGKFADLIAVDESPLADIKQLEHVRFVMKGGTVFRNDYTKWFLVRLCSILEGTHFAIDGFLHNGEVDGIR